MSDYGRLMNEIEALKAEHEALKAEYARVCAERDVLWAQLDHEAKARAASQPAFFAVPGDAAGQDVHPIMVDHDAAHQAEIDRIIAEGQPDA